MVKTIAIDFDGVIHSYEKGWQDGAIYGHPIKGSEEAIQRMMKLYNVFILSTRHSRQIYNWMQLNMPKIPVEIVDDASPFWNKRGIVGITTRKLAASAYIDDRGVRFDNWQQTLEAIAFLHREQKL